MPKEFIFDKLRDKKNPLEGSPSGFKFSVTTMININRMNHFQRLNEVKELKIFFFAQRANTRKQAWSSDRGLAASHSSKDPPSLAY